MRIKTLYKVVSGSSVETEHVLNVLAKDDWHPVTMTCHGQPSVLTVILENKIMEEARLDLSSAIAERTGETTTEEIQ